MFTICVLSLITLLILTEPQQEDNWDEDDNTGWGSW